MTTFGLVHGAWHGAWCFERLVPELETRGHRALAMDLPCDDPSATFEDYAEVALGALGDVGDDLVLVGHSLGAHTIPLVALRRPVRSMVFLCGVVPPSATNPDAPEEPPMDEPGTFGALGKDGRGSVVWTDADAAISAMYPDCAPEDGRWAASKLKPQGQAIWRGFSPIDPWPDVPSASIVCAEDKLLRPAWGRWAALGRLGGAPVVEIPGGHSPFLARPAALADLLASDPVLGVAR